MKTITIEGWVLEELVPSDGKDLPALDSPNWDADRHKVHPIAKLYPTRGAAMEDRFEDFRSIPRKATLTLEVSDRFYALAMETMKGTKR